ncbi:MAG: hypothetical protein DRJ03_16935 [Chloroflexi bacterium]|nr:MAG: hypothetical protein DRI81_15870 [Chloroflexota bacterium]RLC83512.1 MAG: hypothetical protein DRJ03_16935 [Chloroflexota bacterium]
MTEAKVRHMLFQPDPDKIVDIPVEQLLLDPENARLAWRVEGDSQGILVEILWTEMAVDEVAWSIAENGFFRSEPLFVIIEDPEEEDPKKRRYIVVEGNRRLASVLLLRDQELQRRVGATNLPDISAERRSELSTLPAIVYPSRESLWATVGFRHINGIKPWDSFSKAKYVAEVHETYGVSLKEIAERIGDLHATVKRLYRGYKVLEQAESDGVFDREDRARNRFYFSHLYTALDQSKFQEFLGIDSDTSLRPNPVPESNLDELGELMIWLYGKKSEGIEPVVKRQNPDLNILRKVISKPESLSALRSGYALKRSHLIAIGDRKRFQDALTSAKVELQSAKATVTTGYAGEEDLYEIIQDIGLLADTIMREMEDKRAELGIEEARRVRHSADRRRR